MAAEARIELPTPTDTSAAESPPFDVLKLLHAKTYTKASTTSAEKSESNDSEDVTDQQDSLQPVSELSPQQSEQLASNTDEIDATTGIERSPSVDNNDLQSGTGDQTFAGHGDAIDDDETGLAIEPQGDDDDDDDDILESLEEGGDGNNDAQLKVQPPEVVEAIKEANNLSKEQRQSITQLHEFFAELISSDPSIFEPETIKGLIDENKGIIRDSNGQEVFQLKSSYLGKHTKEALKGYQQNFEKVVAPLLVRELLELGAPIPPGFPIPLPEIDNNRIENPKQFFHNIASGRQILDLHLGNQAIPDSASIAKLRAVERWTNTAAISVQTEMEHRVIDIATRRSKSMENIPKTWQIDTPEKAQAAMIVMSRLQEGINLVHAIDKFEEHVQGSAKDNWRDPISKNLPACLTFDGKTARIAPNSLPEMLNLQSPKMLELMRELEEWTTKARQPVDQMAADKAHGNIAMTYTWMNLPQPHHWVNQEAADGIPVMVQRDTKPKEGKWYPYNLLEMRCESQEIRERGDLKGIVLTGTAHYCQDPLCSPGHVFASTAEGTTKFRRDSGVLHPNTMVAITDGESQKFMRARDVQSFVDDKWFWNKVEVSASLTLDFATIASGYGSLKYGLKTLRAIKTGKVDSMVLSAAAKQEAKYGSQGAIKLTELADKLQFDNEFRKATMAELKTLAKRDISHGYRQLLLGGTFFTTNAEDPVLNAIGVGRSFVFQASILKGTFFDPTKRFIASRMGKVEVSTSQALAETLKSESPLWLRTLSSTGDYGFLLGQVPLGADAIHSLTDRQKPPKTRLAEIAGLVPTRTEQHSVEPAVKLSTDAKQIQIAYQNYIDSIQLSHSDEAKIAGLVEETRRLIQPPSPVNGTIDKKALAEWKQQRHELFESRVAPMLLLSGEGIAEAEQRRAKKIGVSSREFADKKMYDADEVHELERTGTHPTAGNLRKVYVATALCLAKDENGRFDLSDTKNTLFERDVEVKPWNYNLLDDARVPVLVPLPAFNRIVPADGLNRTIHQKVKTTELIQDLEKSLLASNSVEEQFAAGQFAARAGMPTEVISATIQTLLANDSSLTPVQQRKALAMLTSVAVRQSKSELTVDADQQAMARVLGAGNSEKDIKAFLGKLSQIGSDSDTRATAAFLKCALERQIFDEKDTQRLNDFLAKPEELTEKKILQTCIDDLKEQHTVGDLDRASTALKTFRAVMSERATVADPNLSAKEIFDLTATFVKCSASFVSDERLQKLQGALIAADNEENRNALAEAQFERLVSIELSLDAAKQLSTRDASTGKTGISLLNSGDEDEQKSAREARGALLQYLKSTANLDDLFAVRDAALKGETIKVLTKLFPPQSPDEEPESITETQRRQFAEFLKQILTGQEKESPKSRDAISNLRHFSQQHSALLSAAGQNPEIRIAAIDALAKLRIHDAQKILEKSASPNHESSAEVRLQALRSLKEISAGGEQEYFEILQTRLRKDQPVESDVAVRLFLQKNANYGRSNLDPLDPANSLASERKADELRRLNITDEDVRKKLIAPKDSRFGWLPPEQLQKDISHARVESTRKLGFKRLLLDTIEADCNPNHKSISVQKQEEVLAEYKVKLASLKATAICSSGEQAQEARLALFYMAAGDHEGRTQALETKSPQDGGLVKSAFKQIIVDKQMIDRFKVEASSALADVVTSLDSNRRLAVDSGMKEIEGMLLSLMSDSKVSPAVQWHALRGLKALSQSDDSKLGVAPDRNYSQKVSDSLYSLLRREMTPPQKLALSKEDLDRYGLPLQMLGMLETELNKPKLCEEDLIKQGVPPQMIRFFEKLRDTPHLSKEDLARQALALQMINFLENQPTEPNTIDSLTGIAEFATKLDKNKSLFFGPIVQRSYEVVADKTTRLPKSASRKNGAANYSSEETNELLTQAYNHATFSRSAGHPPDAPKETKNRIRAEQFNEDKKAIHKILEASGSLRSETANNSAGEKLVAIIKEKGVSDLVKTACALSVVRKTSNPQFRDAAIQHLTDQSINAESLGTRLEATEILTKLTAPNDLRSVETGLTAAKSALAKQMNPGGDRKYEGVLLDEFRKSNPTLQHLVEKYATVLSLLAEVQIKQHDTEAAVDNGLLSLNLWRGKPAAAPLPRTNYGTVDSFALKNELLPRYATSANLHQVTHTLDTLGLALAETKESTTPSDIVAVGHMLRKAIFGSDHPETVRSIGTMALLHTRQARALSGKEESLQQQYDHDTVAVEDLTERLQMQASRHGANLFVPGGLNMLPGMLIHTEETERIDSELKETIASRNNGADKLKKSLKTQIAALEFAGEKRQEQIPLLKAQFGLNAQSTLNAINESLSTLDQKIAASKRLASLEQDPGSKAYLEKQIKTDERLLEQRLTAEVSRREKSFDARSPWVTDLRLKLIRHLSDQSVEGNKKAKELLLKVEQTLPAIDTKEKAAIHFSLAKTELGLNNQHQAMHHFEQQLEIIGAIYGQNSEVYAQTLNAQGMALSQANSGPEAKAKINSALEIHQKFGARSVFSDYLNLAEISQRVDKDPSATVSHLRKSLDHTKAAQFGSSEYQSTTESVARLSKNFTVDGKSEAARQCLTELLKTTVKDEREMRKMQVSDALHILSSHSTQEERRQIRQLLSWLTTQ